MRYSTHMIVTILRIVYEGSCPFLTIKSPYNQDGESVTLIDYLKQFWTSRRKNKETAQSLVTLKYLLDETQSLTVHIQDEAVHTVVRELIEIGVIHKIIVDVNGSATEKLLLTPLGLEIWRKLDNGPLFNQQKISIQDIHQMLTKNFMSEFLRVEKAAWLGIYQDRLKPDSKVPCSPKMICFGMYLLLNGGISKDHKLYLVHTSDKNYQWDETLVKGLNLVAKTLFGKDDLFTVPTLQDELGRRGQLANTVGPCFYWTGKEPLPNGITCESYWWKVGNARSDTFTLDHIIRTLVNDMVNHRGFPNRKELPDIETRLKTLVGFFCHKKDNQLPNFEMAELFPNHPDAEFTYTLQDAIGRVIAEINAIRLENNKN